MTPSEIEEAGRRLLNADNDTFWSSEEIIQNYLYRCCVEMSINTKCIYDIYTTTSVTNTSSYSIPTYVYEIKRIDYDNDKMQLVDMRQDDVIRGLSTGLAGTPQYYYVFGDNFYLTPIPDQSYTINMYYNGVHTMVTAGATLEIPTRYHHHLIDGVTFHMVSKELGDPRISLYRDKWYAGLAEVERQEKERKRGDKFTRVKTEEELYNTYIGIT